MTDKPGTGDCRLTECDVDRHCIEQYNGSWWVRRSPFYSSKEEMTRDLTKRVWTTLQTLFGEDSHG